MKALFLLTIVFFIAAVKIVAQEKSEGCVENRNAPPVSAYYWPPDTVVKVYFARGMFTAEQRVTLLNAMETWSDSNAHTDAGISFSYAGEIDRLATCTGCLTVTRREVHKHDRKHYAFFNPLKQTNDGLLVSAWIDFDFATTNPTALQGYMAHELGHGMGLWDCKSCKKKKTIMNAFPGINNDNGLLAPSACDLEVVRGVYKLQRRVDRILPRITIESNKTTSRVSRDRLATQPKHVTQAKPLVVDEGEEPVEDDTPVVRKP